MFYSLLLVLQFYKVYVYISVLKLSQKRGFLFFGLKVHCILSWNLLQDKQINEIGTFSLTMKILVALSFHLE